MEIRIKSDGYYFSKGTLYLTFDFKIHKDGGKIEVELFDTPNASNEYPELVRQAKNLIAAEHSKWEKTWNISDT
jgi:hypothetical protein